MSQIAILLILSFSLTSSTHASPVNHVYNVGDDVPLFVNKIGPFNNPSETYEYFGLPFCRADNLINKKLSLGEVLSGDRLTKALYDLKFRKDRIGEILCHKEFSRDDIAKFRSAISNEYYFQMYVDDLPLWGFVGKMEDRNWALDGKGPKYYLFRHIQFDAFYNGNQLVEIRAFGDPNIVADVTDDVGTTIEFTYSVLWNTTKVEYKNRMEKYLRAALHPTQRKIHWFSFLNSVVIIVLLMGLLMVLFVRHLKNDLRRLRGGDEEEDKEVGWKYIHGDVFRRPHQMPLFCAFLGCGSQLLAVLFLLYALSCFGILYPYNRGVLSNSLVVIYALTSIVSGYINSTFYNQFAETGWENSVLLAGALYIAPVFLIMFMTNTIATYYGTTSALPIGTVLVILIIVFIVIIPLTAIGGMIGHCSTTKFQPPSATKRVPREIPLPAWYRKTVVQMVIGGLLPFSAIALQLHNLYASLWGYKVFTLSSILFVTFVILVILVAMLSVGLTYIQLTSEDHEWWWRSVLRGGSTAMFMFLYSIYFYYKSNMNGLLQLSFFFGYNVCICLAIFLMLGTIGFFSSFLFVRQIYRAVKNE